MRSLAVAGVAAAHLVLASSALAQSGSDLDDGGGVSSVDVRLGGVTGLAVGSNLPSIGMSLGFRPWRNSADRLSILATGDFRHLGFEEVFDEPTQSRARLGRHAFLLGAALGVDLLRTAHVVVDGRAGITLLRERTNFQIDSANGFVVDDNDWERVCGFSGFGDRCSTEYSTRGTVAIGLRFTPTPEGAFYVGADYTRLIGGHNVFVAVVGVR